MKNLNLFLDDDPENDLTVGLVRLTKDIPDFEFFFALNQYSSNKFTRIKDLTKIGFYYDYAHPMFKTYDIETKTQWYFIANKSSESIKKQEIRELFSDEESINYLLPNYKDVDYLLKPSDEFADFSLILQPENLMFHIQDFQLSSETELYQLIQYYE
ncbi:MAG: IPExxxVDY family protein [Cruoricaptor ignavus]|nr:IPExxxVDY family protein [Cruoricaptor ignavus]